MKGMITIMKKKLYFGTNLKMYKNIKMTTDYLQALINHTRDISFDEITLFVIPSFTSLNSAVKAAERSTLMVGAQDMCWEDSGQFTGEISPLMLKELGLDLVMIGHSERRHIFKETDVIENKKVNAALNHGFTTLLCIGETKEEKDFGISSERLRIQLKVGLYGVTAALLPKIWIAYEPVWSIGVNGTPASPEYAEEMHKIIKSTLKEQFGAESEKIPVLYGGSVNPLNARQLITSPSIDGLFVGRSAWEADAFQDLIRDSISAYSSS